MVTGRVVRRPANYVNNCQRSGGDVQRLNFDLDSFIPKAVDWIGNGGLDRLVAHRHKCDDKGG